LKANYERIHIWHKVKKIMHIDEIAEKLTPMFKEKDLLLVLLFGSSVSGKIHKGSDIDLAFLSDTPVDILNITNKVINLLHANNIDLVDLSRASPLLKFSAAKNGKVLYEKRPGIFNEFYSLAFRMYVDTKKLRDARKTYIKNSLKKRGLV